MKAGLILTPDLQSQEGNRSPGLYSSKYGIMTTLLKNNFSVKAVEQLEVLSFRRNTVKIKS